MRGFSQTLTSVAGAAAVCGLALGLGQAPRAQPVTQAPASATQEAATVEPDALEALKDMSTYLGTLNAFEVRADTTRDLVTENGHRVQLGGVSDYKVRRPNAFRIDVTTDYKQRQFFYDGKQFTVYAPTLGYYASTPAPATILQTIDAVESRFGIDLPLDDLFRWNDPSSHQAEQLSSGWFVGPATVDGVATDHYAFREKDKNIDWEIWIQQGDKPLPRKLVIVDRSDEARPAYSALLTWNTSPTLAADAFTFRPAPDAKQIRLVALEQ